MSKLAPGEAPGGEEVGHAGGAIVDVAECEAGAVPLQCGGVAAADEGKIEEGREGQVLYFTRCRAGALFSRVAS